MKKIYTLFLLTICFCLAGCSSEEAQLVSLGQEEFNVTENGGEIVIGIYANCAWKIHSSSPNVIPGSSQGEGDTSLQVYVERNEDYDSKEFILTVSSKDGSSSDRIIIKQMPKIGMEVGSVGMISEEGGSFTIPLTTNDNIRSVDTPSWITYKSARALNDYTYSFEVEQNTSGNEREGTVVIRGERKNVSFKVSQDSYAPAGVDLTNLPDTIFQKGCSSEIKLIPEYADWDKLKISSDDNIDWELKEGILTLALHKTGPNNVQFYGSDTLICEKTIVRLSDDPFAYLQDCTMYVGEEKHLNYQTYYRDFKVTSSNEHAVGTDGSRFIYGLNEGSSRVTVSSNAYSQSCSITATVKPYILESWIGNITQLEDYSYNTHFRASVRCSDLVSIEGFMVADKNGQVVIRNNGSINKETNDTWHIKTTSLIVKKNSQYSNISDQLGEYTFVLLATFKGEVCNKSIPINSKKVGY